MESNHPPQGGELHRPPTLRRARRRGHTPPSPFSSSPLVHPPAATPPSRDLTVRQTNQFDRFSRPSLSQHGAVPRQAKPRPSQPGPKSPATPERRRTFFSSDELFRPRPPFSPHPRPARPPLGRNPRLAQEQPKLPVPPQPPTNQVTRPAPPQPVRERSLARRRFASRPRETRQAVVAEIAQRADKAPLKPVVLSAASRTLRIVPLGGAGEVGAKNMTVFEFGEDIVAIDCGLGFPPRDEMPGVDYVIPDVTYLQERKGNLRALVFTHGHEDHIGATPFVWPKLGCAMYASPLTAGLINHKMKEAGLNAPVTVINAGDTLHFGKITIEAVRMTHSIPDVLGLAIRCPVGLFLYATDWRIEHTPVLGQPADWSRIAQLAAERITALFSDSTNVERPGYSPTERIIGEAFDKIFQDAPGRIILTQFSSQINRIQQVINAAKKWGRKIAVSGRSMETYLNISMNLGYLKVPEGILIELRRVNALDPKKVAILSTGSQGEEFSSLSRISEGEHRHIKLNKTDTVVIAASAVPGNEVAVAKMIDNLYREGARVIHSKIMDVHVSGHPSREELKFMIGLTHPQYFIPIHGDYRMLAAHGELAVEMGVAEDHVLIVENGQLITFDEKGGRVAEERVRVGDVLIDGLGIGDVGQIVLRDRQAMAKEGIVTFFLVVRQKTGELATSPDIISRGFIYMREAEELIGRLRAEIKRSYNANLQRLGKNWEEIKLALRDDITRFIADNTGRAPLIIPVIVTI